MIPQKSHFLKELKRKSKAQATPKFSDLLPDPGLDLPPVALPLFSLHIGSLFSTQELLRPPPFSPNMETRKSDFLQNDFSKPRSFI